MYLTRHTIVIRNDVLGRCFSYNGNNQVPISSWFLIMLFHSSWNSYARSLEKLARCYQKLMMSRNTLRTLNTKQNRMVNKQSNNYL